MTSLWAQQVAERFWAEAGGAPPGFPRDLRRAVALALPLAVVDLPRLRVGAMRAWLAERGVALQLSQQDRPVRACLLVHRGAGLLFLDGADPDDERRYSLAHEVAHFLVEYVLPRERAASRFGQDILPVLEGMRAPTIHERVDAALAGVDLTPQVHLLERTAGGSPSHPHISLAERRADALALELLAPAEVVRSELGGQLSWAQIASTLCTRFGLPRAVAAVYARRLAPSDPSAPSLLGRLGLQPKG